MRNCWWRSTSRAAMTMLLIALLVSAQEASAAQKSLGFVSWAHKAQLDGYSAASGTSIFAGDLLSTSAAGSLRVQFSSNQLMLPGSSALRFSQADGMITAALAAGTVIFTSPRAGEISIRALDIVIRPQAGAPAVGQVTILAPDELSIVSRSGPLELELDGQNFTLAPGHTWGVRIVPASTDETDRRSARKRRGLIIFLLGIAGAAGITYLIRELHESPDVP